MTLATYEAREYQQKIFEICIEQNSIIYLPTGSGKTFIATLVIDHFRDQITKSLSEGGKRAIFLVNTVQLALQHEETLRNLLGLNTTCWTSETKKKTWNRTKFREEFNANSVIVATAQLFVDAIKHSFIGIEELCVMIFDECHHARSNHPYHELMKQFQYVDQSLYPRLIGLSGLLIGISSSLTTENIEGELKSLESTFQATIITVSKIEEYSNVLLYSTNPNEYFCRYFTTTQSDLSKELITRIGKIRWDLSHVKINGMQETSPSSLLPTKSRKLKELSNLFEEVKVELEELGFFGAYLSLKAIRVQYGLIKKKPNQNKVFVDTVDRCIEYVEELIEFLNDEFDFEYLTDDKILKNSSTKVQALIKLLKLKFNNENRVLDLQCLVFVERRYSAKCLYHLLKLYSEYNSDFAMIKPDFVVGVNGEIPESIEDIMSINSNRLALDKFREKMTNLICTSSVLEEGIDLQMCNLVIMFHMPTTLRSYLQTMGRARIRNSDYIVLIRDDKVDGFVIKCKKYNEIDSKLKKILIGKACDRELSEEDIEKERIEAWQPLITEQRAICNNLSAISLLNRALSRFTNINNLWSRRNSGLMKHIAILKLPSTLHIRPDLCLIESDPFSDIKLAKQHAAFKACQLLFEHGLLDVNLIPN